MINNLFTYRNDSDAMNIICRKVKNKMHSLDECIQEVSQVSFNQKVYMFNFDSSSRNKYVDKFIREFIGNDIKICENIMDFYFPEILSVISELIKNPNINQEDIWNGIELVKLTTNNCFVAYYYLLGLRDQVDYLNLINEKLLLKNFSKEVYSGDENGSNGGMSINNVYDDVYHTIIQVLFFLKVDTVDKFNHAYKNKWLVNDYYTLMTIKKYIRRNQCDINEFIRKMNYLIRKGYSPEISVILVLYKINNRRIMDYKIQNCISLMHIEVIIKLYEDYNIDIREYYRIQKYTLDAIKTLHQLLYDTSYINIRNFFNERISIENFIKFLNPSNFVKIKSINQFINNINNMDWTATIYYGMELII